jgi:predicted O-methyltransferase YrrM
MHPAVERRPMPSILTDLTAEYLSSVRPPADDLVREMEAHAERDRVPIAAREVATLQRILATAVDAERVLEFGTAIGYSTVQLARLGPEVVTMEVDEERIAAAREYARRAGVEDRIDLHEGPALEVLDDVTGPFDVVFLDAVKTEYPAYLERSLPMLRPGGVVMVDNVLWDGRVPEAHHTGEVPDEATGTFLEFNEAFVEHPQLEAVVTPLADGTGIGIKRERGDGGRPGDGADR